MENTALRQMIDLVRRASSSPKAPVTAYPETKGNYSPNTPVMVEYLQLDRMTSGLVAQPTHVYDSNFFLSSLYQCFCWIIRISKHVSQVFMEGILF